MSMCSHCFPMSYRKKKRYAFRGSYCVHVACPASLTSDFKHSKPSNLNYGLRLYHIFVVRANYEHFPGKHIFFLNHL